MNIIFEYDKNSIVNVKAIDLSNKNNKEELIVEKPKLYNAAEIKEFKNEDIEMKELYMKDYDAYKYDIIELEEKLNKSKNQENMLKLIDKYYYLMKKPCILKVQISFMKYYFWKIHIYLTFLEKNKIQLNDSLFKKLENIIDIFSIIKFYDIGQECISNENSIQINNNYNHCIVEEIFDDLIDDYRLNNNNKLYYLCTKIKIINYFEKVMEFIRYIDLNIQGINKIEILNKAVYYLAKAEKTIQKIKKITFYENSVEISSFQIILKDLKNLKKIMEKDNYKDEKLDDLDDDLNEKYMQNSLKYLTDKKVYINENKEKIEYYMTLLNNLKLKINNIENYDLQFIGGSFFFILEVLKKEEDEDKISKLHYELCKIKGYFYNKNDIVGKDKRKEEVSSFIYSLLALLENKNKIDIRIYLNKLLEIFTLI